jgi:RNA polymerase sigma factor (sigma-70 family)
MDVLRARRTITVADVPDQAITDGSFLRFEEDQRFFAMVAQLPEGQKNTLILRYFADLDDRSISKILECSVETVRSQAYRGLEKLRAARAASVEVD